VELDYDDNEQQVELCGAVTGDAADSGAWMTADEFTVIDNNNRPDHRSTNGKTLSSD